MANKENKSRKKRFLASVRSSGLETADCVTLTRNQRATVAFTVLMCWGAAICYGLTIVAFSQHEELNDVVSRLCFSLAIAGSLYGVFWGLPLLLLSFFLLLDAVTGKCATPITMTWFTAISAPWRQPRVPEIPEPTANDTEIPAVPDQQSDMSVPRLQRMSRVLMVILLVAFVAYGVFLSPFSIGLQMALVVSTLWLVYVQHVLLHYVNRSRNAVNIEQTFLYIAGCAVAFVLCFGVGMLLAGSMGMQVGRLVVTLVGLVPICIAWMMTRQVLKLSNDAQLASLSDATFAYAALGVLPLFSLGIPILCFLTQLLPVREHMP